MRLIMPRWLIVVEIALGIAAIGVMAYKARTRVLPLPVEAIRQKRLTQKPPGQPTILDYYRKYPDRYIRVENEVWVLDRDTHAATHSFSLRNLATVTYADIEVRITYEGAGGKTSFSRDIKIPGLLQGQSTREFRKMKIPNVPGTTRNALAVVTRARVVQ